MLDEYQVDVPRKAPLKPGETEWTDERTALLKKLWADGKSQADIASEMGLQSRGAVSGKIARLGLSGRIKSTGHVSRPRSYRARSAPDADISARFVIMPTGQLAFEQLTDDVCHFPVGDGPFLFCGSPTTFAPYCTSCTRIAYRVA